MSQVARSARRWLAANLLLAVLGIGLLTYGAWTRKLPVVVPAATSIGIGLVGVGTSSYVLGSRGRDRLPDPREMLAARDAAKERELRA